MKASSILFAAGMAALCQAPVPAYACSTCNEYLQVLGWTQDGRHFVFARERACDNIENGPYDCYRVVVVSDSWTGDEKKYLIWDKPVALYGYTKFSSGQRRMLGTRAEFVQWRQEHPLVQLQTPKSPGGNHEIRLSIGGKQVTWSKNLKAFDASTRIHRKQAAVRASVWFSGATTTAGRLPFGKCDEKQCWRVRVFWSPDGGRVAVFPGPSKERWDPHHRKDEPALPRRPQVVAVGPTAIVITDEPADSARFARLVESIKAVGVFPSQRRAPEQPIATARVLHAPSLERTARAIADAIPGPVAVGAIADEVSASIVIEAPPSAFINEPNDHP